MNIKNKTILLVCGFIIIAGCSVVAPKEPDKILPSRSDTLEQAEVVPHESDLLGDPLSIIVGIDTVGADQLQLRDGLLQGVYTTLSDNWSKVKLSGSKSTTSFIDEIALSLRNTNEASYLGAQKVNYILAGKLEYSSFTTQYSKPSFLCTSVKEGCRGSCEYEVKAAFSLEAESLPENRRSKKWVLKSTKNRSFDADNYCPKPTGRGEPNQVYKKLIQEVTGELVKCSQAPLEDYFSSRGYILDYRSDGKEFRFDISAGSAAGIRRGDKVIIERLDSYFDAAIKVVAEGEVVQVTDKRGTISVPNQAMANQVKKYDRVRVKKRRYIPDLLCKLVLKE